MAVTIMLSPFPMITATMTRSSKYLFFTILQLLLNIAFAVDICDQKVIKDVYDNHIYSSGTRLNYLYSHRHDNEDLVKECSTTLYVPKNFSVNFRFTRFNLERAHDILEVDMGSANYSLTEDSYDVMPNGPHDVPEVKFKFRSEKAHDGYGSFNLTYSFERSLSKVETIITGYNGVVPMNATIQTKQTIQFQKLKSWTRHVEFVFDGSLRCPNSSSVTVITDGRIRTICYMTNATFEGTNVTIVIISKGTFPNLQEIRFKSIRHRGMKSCFPDFDCGDKTCVPLETKCDYIHDCENDSDEKNCDVLIRDDDDNSTDTINVPMSHPVPCKRVWMLPTMSPSIAPQVDHDHDHDLDHSFLYFLLGSASTLIATVIIMTLFRKFMSERRMNADSIHFKVINEKLINM